jgi:hypothetical protein
VIVACGQNPVVVPKPNTTAKDLIVVVCVPIALCLGRVGRWEFLAKEGIERVDESPRVLRHVFVDLPHILRAWRVESSAKNHLSVENNGLAHSGEDHLVVDPGSETYKRAFIGLSRRAVGSRSKTGHRPFGERIEQRL